MVVLSVSCYPSASPQRYVTIIALEERPRLVCPLRHRLALKLLQERQEQVVLHAPGPRRRP